MNNNQSLHSPAIGIDRVRHSPIATPFAVFPFLEQFAESERLVAVAAVVVAVVAAAVGWRKIVSEVKQNMCYWIHFFLGWTKKIKYREKTLYDKQKLCKMRTCCCCCKLAICCMCACNCFSNVWARLCSSCAAFSAWSARTWNCQHQKERNMEKCPEKIHLWLIHSAKNKREKKGKNGLKAEKLFSSHSLKKKE